MTFELSLWELTTYVWTKLCSLGQIKNGAILPITVGETAEVLQSEYKRASQPMPCYG